MDPWAKADALSRAVSHVGADLVLCGKQSLDTGNAQMAAFMATALTCPLSQPSPN